MMLVRGGIMKGWSSMRLLWVLPLVGVLTACGGGEKKSYCEESQDPSGALQLRICTDGFRYDFAEPVHILFTVTNISDAAVTLDGGEGPAVDIRVENDLWSAAGDAVTVLTLEPQQTHTIEWVWPTAGTDLDAITQNLGQGPAEITIGVKGLAFTPAGARASVPINAYYRYP